MNIPNKIRAVSHTVYAKSAVAAVVLTAGAAANAAGIDVTGVVTAVGETAAPVGLIGGAVLLIIVAIKAFKWVAAAIKT